MHRAAQKNKPSCEYHALKFMHAPAASRSISREAEVLKLFSHPNVLKLLGCYGSDGHRLVLAFPEADSDIRSVLCRRAGLSLGRDLSHIAATQCFRGLAHVHLRGVVHRDLKPANILVHFEATPRFVLADFGRSRRVDVAARAKILYVQSLFVQPLLHRRLLYVQSLFVQSLLRRRGGPRRVEWQRVG